MEGHELTWWQRHRLIEQAKKTQEAHVYRRTLAVLEVSRGQSLAQVAEALGVTRQSVYNWVASYMEARNPQALEDEDRSGRPSLWTEDRQALLRALMNHSPQVFGYFATDWTVPLLQEQLEHHAAVRFSDETVRRGLAARGYVWKRGRYELQPDPELEKKTTDSPASPASATSQRSVGRG